MRARSWLAALAAFAREAGFTDSAIEEVRPPRFSAFPDASVMTASKGRAL